MLTLLFLLQAAAVAPAPNAPWTAQTRTDAAGRVSTSAFVLSGNGDARLMVRCDRAGDPGVSLILRTRTKPLDAGDNHVVTVTVDGGKPIDAVWQFPAGAALLSEPEAVTALTTAIDGGASVRLDTDDGGSHVVATFPGAKGHSGVRDVLAACGYALGVVPAPVKPAAK